MRVLFPVEALLLCALLHAGKSSSFGTPLVYDQIIQADKVTDPNHWAFYDSTVREGNVSKATFSDDTIRMQPVDFCMPFFSHDSMNFYINSNGFISPVPFPMCTSFCHGNAGKTGYYKFNDDIQPTGGGDWPMLGLYVYDLDPTNDISTRNQGTIYFRKWNKWGMDIAAVEYRNIAQYLDFTVTDPADTSITAQVELWPNGTIIFRYEKVLTRFQAQDAVIPSVGLIYSRNHRVVSTTPRARSGNDPVTISAIRYEPQPDPCLSKGTTCQACLQSTGNLTCKWCSSTNQCLSERNALDICRYGDLRGNESNCAFFPQTGHNDSTSNQFFYATKLRDNVTFVNIDGNDGLPNKIVHFNESNSTYFVPYVINLPFNISFFYNPPTKDPNSPRIVNRLYLSPEGFISVLDRRQQCESSGTSTNSRYCAEGSFQYTIQAFSSDLVFAPRTRIHSVTLPERNTSGAFCTEDMLDSVSNLCPESFVLEIANLQSLSTNVPTYPQQFTTQMIFVKGDGVIQFRYDSAVNATMVIKTFTSDGSIPQVPSSLTCPVTSLWAHWARPTSGLIREGRDTDAGSSIIPWPVLEPNMIATAIPVPGCVDCGSNGRCDYTTRACICDFNWQGESCDECAPGFWGSECLACPSCENGGSCDEGLEGSGTCDCTPPFSGRLCEITCDSIEASICDGCNKKGGYCECGNCVCFEDRGWNGDRCDTWRDPCSRYSLDGCPTCAASISLGHSSVRCSWCGNDYCFAESGQWGLVDANISQCRNAAVFKAGEQAICIPYRRQAAQAGSFALLVVVIAFVILGVAACVAVMVFCGCKRRSVNILEAAALPGTPDFDPPPREREVIEVHVLAPQPRRPVLGLPLKQIPLKELYDIQRGKKPPPDALTGELAQ